MPRWSIQETGELHLLAKRKVAFEAICLKIGKSPAAARGKARRDRIKLNFASPLPEVDPGGRLVRLGGVDIPDGPQWVKPATRRVESM
jgi:hypothetical protein